MIAETKSRFFQILVLGGTLITLNSCSTTKYLSKDQKLYHKTEVTFTNPKSFDEKKTIKRDVLAITLPKPNNKINLRFYNLMGVPNKEKGLWFWLGNKFGEPPVLFDPGKTSRSQIRIEQYLRNNGYLGARVQTDTLSRGHKMKVAFHLTSKGQYKVNSFQLPEDSTTLARLFHENKKETKINIGEPYRFSRLSNERVRLARLAQDNGYIQFTEDDLFFLADTTNEDYQIDLYLYLREQEDPYQTYRLGKTSVYMNYNLRSPEELEIKAASSAGGLYYSEKNNVVREAVIDRLVPQKSGDLYSKTLQDVTFNRLQGLGIFKFVNIKYEQDSTSDSNKVNRNIYLTPNAMQDITGTLELNNQTGNYYGTSAGITYTHKNLFGGAERFNLSLSGGLATQLNGDANLINTSNIDFKLGLAVPKVIAPFNALDSANSFIPKTLISAGVGYEERVQFYAMQTGEIKFGYRWQRTIQAQHEFYPLSFNMFNLIKSSPEFEAIRAQNLRLDRSFDNTLLGGLKYAYTYSSPGNSEQRNITYFSGEVETSGNLLYLISKLGGTGDGEPFQLFGLPVAQFVKLIADWRRYMIFRKTTLVTRAYTGVGLAYGNLDDLPYSKQFVTGGANGMRAFPLRGLGPGNFVRQEGSNQAIDEQFLDQTGNIKLEMNVELRFPLFSYLKGAVFIDAGNIWLVNNSEIPEGNFKLNRFMDELAIGTGLGFRLDFTYFVIRLDTSFPLRKPVSDEGFKWVVGEVNPFNGSWRGENLQWHLAIGYPF